MSDADRPVPPWEQGHLDRLAHAAGVEPGGLHEPTAKILRWLAGWDEPTIAGVVDLLDAARETGRAEGRQ